MRTIFKHKNKKTLDFKHHNNINNRKYASVDFVALANYTAVLNHGRTHPFQLHATLFTQRTRKAATYIIHM